MARLHNQIMNLLIVDIVSGVVEPGQRLAREADLATQFGVSRGVAREAIRGLEERGLVRVKHGRGTTVNAAHEWNVLDSDVLAVLLQSEAREGVVFELLETRKLIEVEAAGLAAERATEADLAEIAEALTLAESAAERANRNPAAAGMFVEADFRFHRAVMNGAHNRVLSRLTEPVRGAIVVTQAHSRSELRFKHGMAEHAAIASAIAAGEGARARAAMAQHLASVEIMLRARYEQEIAGDAPSA